MTKEEKKFLDDYSHSKEVDLGDMTPKAKSSPEFVNEKEIQERIKKLCGPAARSVLLAISYGETMTNALDMIERVSCRICGTLIRDGYCANCETPR